ncbi:MAG: sigma-54-dependent Fis family transcriptional regulator [Pirellulales bacterium]|nr:sigma-54-dependent Fis family transcriptional regulator [Pirellulales bacterium]
MRVLHYNDEERELHLFLAARQHVNTILPAEADPFVVAAAEPFDAAFIGLHPHGLELIRTLKRTNSDCLVTIITSDNKTRMAVEAMKCGAFDYLLSPLDFTEVERSYILLEREQRMLAERRQLQAQLNAVTGASRLVGASDPMRQLRQLIGRAARTAAPVLVIGETGTGKELVAQLLHEQSARRNGRFVSINCNAIPPTLMESELFGHRKGSFTGADADREGLLVQADGGTCFLDEIQDFDLAMQGKLLRVLQHGEILPVGERLVRTLDVRFVAATNADLGELVRLRKFREDLFYRLNVVPIVLPPLRDRLEDLSMLARHFIDRYCQREGREPLKVAPEVWRRLNAHDWPGNVRELENLCQRAVALTDGDTFDVDVLAHSSHFSPSATEKPQPAATACVDPPAASAVGLRDARDRTTRLVLEQALVDHFGNISRAANALGISRTTFYEKARKLGVALPRERLRLR